MTAEDVIRKHREELLYDDPHNAFRITVRRAHILDDSVAVIRSEFDERKHIRVRFMGKAAVDAEGLGENLYAFHGSNCKLQLPPRQTTPPQSTKTQFQCISGKLTTCVQYHDASY